MYRGDFFIDSLSQEHNVLKVEELVKELFDKTAKNEKGLENSLETLEKKVLCHLLHTFQCQCGRFPRDLVVESRLDPHYPMPPLEWH